MAVPTPGPAAAALPARHVLEYWLFRYRRTWRGSAVTSFLNPALYLAAMGLGLGALVDRGTGSATLSGAGYLTYLAPGLLAATAMQTVAMECTWPVMGALRWERSYLAMSATPLRPADLFAGHQLFVVFRLTTGMGAFVLVAALFGAWESWWAVVAWPAAVLCGLAHGAAVEAFAVTRHNEKSFAALQRFVFVPLFLFSGVFFPVEQLPGGLAAVAYATPLWHGADLCRDLALGRAGAVQCAVHVGYLLAWLAVGAVAALRCYRRRLEV